MSLFEYFLEIQGHLDVHFDEESIMAIIDRNGHYWLFVRKAHLNGSELSRKCQKVTYFMLFHALFHAF